jgi:hypothetical protein
MKDVKKFISFLPTIAYSPAENYTMVQNAHGPQTLLLKFRHIYKNPWTSIIASVTQKTPKLIQLIPQFS